MMITSLTIPKEQYTQFKDAALKCDVRVLGTREYEKYFNCVVEYTDAPQLYWMGQMQWCMFLMEGLTQRYVETNEFYKKQLDNLYTTLKQ